MVMPNNFVGAWQQLQSNPWLAALTLATDEGLRAPEVNPIRAPEAERGAKQRRKPPVDDQRLYAPELDPRNSVRAPEVDPATARRAAYAKQQRNAAGSPSGPITAFGGSGNYSPFGGAFTRQAAAQAAGADPFSAGLAMTQQTPYGQVLASAAAPVSPNVGGRNGMSPGAVNQELINQILGNRNRHRTLAGVLSGDYGGVGYNALNDDLRFYWANEGSRINGKRGDSAWYRAADYFNKYLNGDPRYLNKYGANLSPQQAWKAAVTDVVNQARQLYGDAGVAATGFTL